MEENSAEKTISVRMFIQNIIDVVFKKDFVLLLIFFNFRSAKKTEKQFKDSSMLAIQSKNHFLLLICHYFPYKGPSYP